MEDVPDALLSKRGQADKADRAAEGEVEGEVESEDESEPCRASAIAGAVNAETYQGSGWVAKNFTRWLAGRHDSIRA